MFVYPLYLVILLDATWSQNHSIFLFLINGQYNFENIWEKRILLMCFVYALKNGFIFSNVLRRKWGCNFKGWLQYIYMKQGLSKQIIPWASIAGAEMLLKVV